IGLQVARQQVVNGRFCWDFGQKYASLGPIGIILNWVTGVNDVVCGAGEILKVQNAFSLERGIIQNQQVLFPEHFHYIFYLNPILRIKAKLLVETEYWEVGMKVGESEKYVWLVRIALPPTAHGIMKEVVNYWLFAVFDERL